VDPWELDSQLYKKKTGALGMNQNRLNKLTLSGIPARRGLGVQKDKALAGVSGLRRP